MKLYIAWSCTEYSTGTYPDITDIRWSIEYERPSVEWLLNFPNLLKLDIVSAGLTDLLFLEGCPQLVELDCFDNKINSLQYLRFCPSLKVLNFGGNPIRSLKGIENCPHLRKLRCVGLTRLPAPNEGYEYMEQCPLLTEIYLTRSKVAGLEWLRFSPGLTSLTIQSFGLKSARGLRYCPNLTYIDISYSLIRSLTDLKSCPLLQELKCRCCELRSLEGLANCPDLRTLNCPRNSIASLDGVQDCRQLTSITCTGCRSDIRMDAIVYLDRLRQVVYDNAVFISQTPQVRHRLMALSITAANTIYTDTQNVHDSSIQQSVRDSVRNLMLDPKPTFNLESIIGSGMSETAVSLIVSYCEDKTVHSDHYLMYSELLAYVWARANRSEHRTELIKILDEQIQDSACKCFTGRFNRTLSVLVGFSPDIKIEIADTSRIGAIIIAARNRLDPYSTDAHINLSRELLIDAGYDEDTIRPWLEAIDD